MVQQIDQERSPKTPAYARGQKTAARVLARLIGNEPKELGELVERMRADYQVRLSELTLQALMKTVPVAIHTEERGDAEEQETSEQQPVQTDERESARARVLARKLKKLWDDRLQEMLECFSYGRVAFEKVWNFDSSTGLQFIEDLEPLPFKQTTMQLDEEGGFAGLTLSAGGDRAGGDHKIELEPIKSWWLAIDTTATEPHGRSRYLGAPHEVWKFRRKLFRLREVFMNRCVLKGGVAHVPMGTNIDDQGNTTDDSTNVEKAFEDYVSGGLLMFPNHRDPDTKEYLYDVEIPEGLNDPGPLEAAIDGSDVEQVRAFGIPEKTIMEGDAVGSYAMVSMQMLVLYAICDDLLSQIAGSFQAYVIDKVVEQNWDSAQQPSITITVPKLARQSDSMVVEIVKSMLTSQTLSPLVTSGTIDILAMLSGLDIPLSDQAETTIRNMIEQSRTARG